MICKNRGCKFQTENERCSIVRKLELNREGKCISFAPGFMYYVDLAYAALSRNNFIQTHELTNDLKIGLYYVMNLFDLSFVESHLPHSRKLGYLRCIFQIRDSTASSHTSSDRS